MAITTEHQAAERRFREIVRTAELPEPDEVEYDEASVVFLWDEKKLVVVIDLDGTPVDA
jgi:hypothetical protein